MDTGLTIVLTTLILCIYNLLSKLIGLKQSKNSNNCNCKRTEKYKDNYVSNAEIKLENKSLDDTLTSDIWES